MARHEGQKTGQILYLEGPKIKFAFVTPPLRACPGGAMIES
jgi:hypothetical protein